MNIQQKKRAKSNKLSDDKYVISLNYFNKRNIIVSGKCSVYFKGVDNMDILKDFITATLKVIIVNL